MVADAVHSRDPLGNLKWLSEQHPDDEIVKSGVQRATQYVMRRMLGLRGKASADMFLPSAIAAVARAAERDTVEKMASALARQERPSSQVESDTAASGTGREAALRPPDGKTEKARIAGHPDLVQPPRRTRADAAASQAAKREVPRSDETGRGPASPDQGTSGTEIAEEGPPALTGEVAGDAASTSGSLLAYMPAVVAFAAMILLVLVLWRRFGKRAA